jgi:hypothetical protein
MLMVIIMSIRVKPTSDFDVVMRNVWLRLREDFSTVLGFEVCELQKRALLESVSSFRDTPCGSWLNLPPYFAKCYIQLDKFLKRYRFANDKYTNDELLAKAEKSFCEDNLRVASHLCVKPSSYIVLQTARRIIKDALKEYDIEEHINACRFGKNASVGSPFAKSYLDLKICKGPLTGSPGHIQWFKDHVLPDDKILSGVLRRHRPAGLDSAYVECSSLPQQFVPKAFDKLRGITPNTLLGSFYTYGLGVVLRDRLEENCGIDLATQQSLHAKKVVRASVTRVLVTGDLTSASQSITSWHVKKLFPYKWYKALNFGRITDISMNGTNSYSATFAGMGIGFTFPLQTLVFYSILKAIQELFGKTGFISVYGDDLIYPRTMHEYVVPIFEDLGFIFNASKTYSTEYFRESCGSDFYRGVDCRPVSPAGADQSSFRTSHIANLYKLRNNLTRKWDMHEIGRTLHYIDCQIAGSSGSLLFVPPNFPDTAGIRIDTPNAGKRDYNICYTRPRYIVSKQSWAFRYIAVKPQWRDVVGADPFFWDNMRSTAAREQEHAMEPWDTSSTSSLKWRRCNKPWKKLTKADLVASKLHVGKQYERLTPQCQVKGCTNYHEQSALVFTWHEAKGSLDIPFLESRTWTAPERWVPVGWINVSPDERVLTRSALVSLK